MAKKRKSKPRKVKIPPVDGLGPKDIEKIRKAIRQVWHWSHAKKLVVKRCTDKNGFGRCEGKTCKKRKCAKVYVDHIEKVGDVDAGFIARLFCPSSKMQGLCKKCHDAKTKIERDADKHRERQALAIATVEGEDFY